jgi:hypothetical protein
MDEKQERFLKRYVLFVVFFFLFYGIQFIFGMALDVAFLSAFVFILWGTVLLIWAYRKTNEFSNNTTQ